MRVVTNQATRIGCSTIPFPLLPSLLFILKSQFKMLISISPILLFLSSTIAAPSSENQLSFTAESFQVGLASTVHQFTSSLISSIGFNSLLSSFSANEYGLQTKDESKTLWKVINENDHFTREFLSRN